MNPTVPDVINPMEIELAPLDFRILIAEDNLINQKVAIRLLKHLGYQSQSANNGQHALELLAREAFDLVFMDIDMPEIDGLTTMGYIREFMPHRDPFIVALSQIDSTVRVDQCIDAGANSLLPKPLRTETILAVLYEANQRKPAVR